MTRLGFSHAAGPVRHDTGLEPQTDRGPQADQLLLTCHMHMCMHMHMHMHMHMCMHMHMHM